MSVVQTTIDYIIVSKINIYKDCQCLQMSLLPVVRWCTKTNLNRLVVLRNVPKYSPIFKMLDVLRNDELGKHMKHSTSPNCTIHNLTVIAARDITPGTELTVTLTIPEYLDSI